MLWIVSGLSFKKRITCYIPKANIVKVVVENEVAICCRPSQNGVALVIFIKCNGDAQGVCWQTRLLRQPFQLQQVVFAVTGSRGIVWRILLALSDELQKL